MHVYGIDRAVLATDDVVETADLFGELLGVPFGERVTFEQTSAAGEYELETAISGLASLDLVGPADDRPDNPVRRYLDAHGPGAYGVAFRVADLERVSDHLTERGVDPVGRIEVGDFAELFYHPDDFAGAFVLLAEYDHPFESNLRRADG